MDDRRMKMRLVVGSCLLLGGAAVLWLLMTKVARPMAQPLVIVAVAASIASICLGGGILAHLGQKLTDYNQTLIDFDDNDDPLLWDDYSHHKIPPNSAGA